MEKIMRKFNRLKSHLTHKLALAALAGTLIVGCASNPGPIQQMATSRAAISSANSAEGNEYAPIQFKLAIDKMAGAERAMANMDYALARKLAEQAQVDAQLAGAAARSAKAQKAADAVQEDSRVLRNEIDRKTN
jgi:hypothetical protein